MDDGLLSVDERYNLITRGLHLFEPSTTEDSLKSLLREKRNPRIAWVTAPTGKPHVGYLIPLAKLIDFLRAGLQPVILYVDVYAYLVNCVHPLPLVRARLAYYRHLTTAVLRSLGVSDHQVEHITESSYAYTEEFITQFHKLAVVMKQRDAHCTSEVAQTELLSPLLCCIHQTLGEVFTDVDIQFGGLDQRDLFRHSAQFLPMIGHKSRKHLMNAMVPGLSPGTSNHNPNSSPEDNKMSSSHPANTKIEFMDNLSTLTYKIESATCLPYDAGESNTIMSLVKEVIWPIARIYHERRLRNVGYNIDETTTESTSKPFIDGSQSDQVILTAKTQNGLIEYTCYQDLENDICAGNIEPYALKELAVRCLHAILSRVGQIYDESEEWRSLELEAYPPGAN